MFAFALIAAGRSSQSLVPGFPPGGCARRSQRLLPTGVQSRLLWYPQFLHRFRAVALTPCRPRQGTTGQSREVLADPRVRANLSLRALRWEGYFPMQNVEKIRLRISSEVVWPVRESRAQRAR